MIENGQFYYAKVVANNDPKKQGAVQVIIPELNETQAFSKWFRPMIFPSGNGHGMYYETQKDDLVTVLIQSGMQDFGGMYFSSHPRRLESETADNLTDNYFGVVTVEGDKLKIAKDGSLTFKNSDDKGFTLDSSNNAEILARTIQAMADSGANLEISNSGVLADSGLGGFLEAKSRVNVGNSAGTINNTNAGIYFILEQMVNQLATLAPTLPLTILPLIIAEKAKNDLIFE